MPASSSAVTDRSFRLADGEDRTRGQSHDPIRDAAEERSIETAAAVGADHDQVRPLIGGERHDLLMGRTVAHRDADAEAGRLPGLRPLVELLGDPLPALLDRGAQRSEARNAASALA